jgi:hypothetical protein
VPDQELRHSSVRKGSAPSVLQLFLRFIAIFLNNDTCQKKKKKLKWPWGSRAVTTCDQHQTRRCTVLGLCSKVFCGGMGNRKISNDLKRAALHLRARGQDSISQITEICDFSRSTFFRVLRCRQLTGDVAKAIVMGHGCPRSLLHTDCCYLLQLARHKPIRKSTGYWGESTGAGEAYLELEQVHETHLELEQLPETTLSPGVPGSRHLYLNSDSESTEKRSLCCVKVS